MDQTEYKPFDSYGSYGEDALLNGVMQHLSWVMNTNLFDKKTYLDVGAFHPVMYSNTFFLHRRGWTGTLVDPNPHYNQVIKETRPNDLLLNYAVEVESGEKEFYVFADYDSSNTTSLEYAERKVKSQRTDIAVVKTVQAKTIDEIVNMHISYFKEIPFFMSIDIEGKDLDVISTYSSSVKIPFIMIEDISNSIFSDSPIRKALEGKGYLPIATTVLTTLYVDSESKYYKNIEKLGQFDE